MKFLSILLYILLSALVLIYSYEINENDTVERNVAAYLYNAEKAVYENDFLLCINHLQQALQLQSNHPIANQVIGSAYLKLDMIDKAIHHIKLALDLLQWNDPSLCSNYIEAIRRTGDLNLASEIGYKTLLYHNNSDNVSLILYNLAVVEEERKEYNKAYELYKRLIDTSTTIPLLIYYKHLIDLLLNDIYEYTILDYYAEQAIQYYPNEQELYVSYGLSLHYQNRLQDSLSVYQRSYALNPKNYKTVTHIAAVYQTLGQAEEALYYYQLALPFQATDSGVRNNYGTLYSAVYLYTSVFLYTLHTTYMTYLAHHIIYCI